MNKTLIRVAAAALTLVTAAPAFARNGSAPVIQKNVTGTGSVKGSNVLTHSNNHNVAGAFDRSPVKQTNITTTGGFAHSYGNFQSANTDTSRGPTKQTNVTVVDDPVRSSTIEVNSVNDKNAPTGPQW